MTPPNVRTLVALSCRPVEPELLEKLDSSDAAAYDLTNRENWAKISVLIDGKFGSYLKERYPSDFKNLADRDQPPPFEVFDEFVIEQARTIGVRILFNPKVLMTLYRWGSFQSEAAVRLWERFSKNVQAGLEGRRITVRDPRTPKMRHDLIEGLKVLKRQLRAKGSVSAWNFPVIVNVLSTILKSFRGSEILQANGTLFTEYVCQHEEQVKRWLIAKGSDRDLADSFLGWAWGYKNGELARQAVQKVKARRRSGQHSKLNVRTSTHPAL